MATRSRNGVDPGFRVFPNSVEINPYEVGKVYTARLSVKNVSGKYKGIRLRPPLLKQWALTRVGSDEPATTTVKVAPGLEVHFEVTFTGEEEVDLADNVQILTETDRIDVPLRALAPSHKVVVEGNLDFGVVAHETVAERVLRIRNTGPREAPITITFDRSITGLDAVCEADVLAPAGEPGSEADLVVTFHGEELGVVGGGNASVDVQFADKTVPIKIPVSASVVKHTVQLVGDDGAVPAALDMGTVYTGTTVVRRVRLRNAGPTAVPFVALVGAAQAVKDVVRLGQLVEADLAELVSSRTVLVSPRSGVLDPFEEREVTVRFVPPVVESKKGFLTTLKADGEVRTERGTLLVVPLPHDHRPGVGRVVLSKEDSEASGWSNEGLPPQHPPLTVQIEGRSVKPGIKLTDPVLVFGDVATHEHADVVVTVQNLTPELPAVVKMPACGFFHPDQPLVALGPGASASVVYTYCPKALGRHKTETFVEVQSQGGRLLQRVPIKLLGSSSVVGRLAAELPRAVDGLPPGADAFGRSRKFVTENQAATLGGTTALGLCTQAHGRLNFARKRTWDADEHAKQFFATHRQHASEHGWSLEETVARAKHREHYDTLLVESRKERKRRAAKLVNPQDPLQIGLESHAGLKEPQLQLPQVVDPLWLQEKVLVRPKHRPPLPNDPKLLARCRFKPRPESEKEKVDCKAVIMGPEVAKIQACRVLDFGQVALGQSSVQHFTVTNGLAQSIQVRVDLVEGQSVEVKEVAPRQMVVPAGATAGFQVRITTHTPGNFAQDIAYTINGHQFSFRVAADVVPVTVDISNEKLYFHFTPDDWRAFVEQSVYLDNPFDFPVVYQMKTTSEIFQVTPQEGTMEGRGRVTATVRWTPQGPNSKGSNNGALLVHVQGGLEPVKVNLEGDLPEGKMALMSKVVDFETVAVGMPRTKTVVLRNQVPHECQYQVIPSPGLKCHPTHGRVPAKGSLELEVTCFEESPCTITGTITINVRGGKQIRAPVVGTVVMPELGFTQSEVDFGGVIVGGAGKQPLTLVNRSLVLGAVVLDLTEHQELSLELPKEAWSAATYDQCPVQIVRETKGRGAQDGQVVRRRSSILTQIFEGGQKYRISVAAASTLPLVLVHRPREVGPRTMKVVLRDLNGDLFAEKVEEHADQDKAGESKTSRPSSRVGTAASGASRRSNLGGRRGTATGRGKESAVERGTESPVKLPAPIHSATVSTLAIEPKLLLSDTHVDFGKRVVLRGTTASHPYTQVVTMVSRAQRPLDFLFSAPQADPKGTSLSTVYSITPSEGVLQPDTPLRLTVSFRPTEPGACPARVSLYVENDLDTRYLELHLGGVGTLPRLRFDIDELLLPPVPLGLKSTAQFFVINDGYDNLDLKVNVPVDKDHIPISLEFPEGTMIGVAKERLPVVVTFCSDVATGFTSALEFMDFEGHSYRLPVSGIADNSILTTSEFIGKNRDRFDLSRPGRDGRIMLNTELLFNLPNPAILQCIGPQRPNQFFVRYLNATTMLGPFKDVIQDCRSTRGRVFLDIIELLSGKPVQGRVKQLPANRREALDIVVRQYDTVLTFLNGCGGLVNSVKPEYLLDEEDLTRLLSMRGKPDDDENEHLSFWEQVESSFRDVSEQAWNAVLAQLARLFIVSRCSPKSLRGNHRADFGLTNHVERALVASNIYSAGEMVLLRWSSHLMHAEFPALIDWQLRNFESDFVDGLALYAILAKHWEALSRFRAQICTPPDGATREELHEEQSMANASVVCDMLKALELPFEIRPQEILAPVGQEMVIFLAYLYQILPQLEPQAEILFDARLNEVQERYVELNNPSNKSISYYARLEGHADFELVTSTLYLQPKSKGAFPVRCKSTISKPVTGHLVLASKRDGTAHGATLVFALKSMVNTQAPVQSLAIEGVTYQMDSVEVEIRNPFPGDCDFTIHLEQSSAGVTSRMKQLQPLRTVRGRAGKEADEKAEKAAEKDGAAHEKGSNASHNGEDAHARTVQVIQPLEMPDPKVVLSQGGKQEIAAERYPLAFGCERQRLRLRQGASDKVDIAFLPFFPGQHTCHVVLEDQNFGVFRVEIAGNAKQPAPLQRLTFQVEQEGNAVHDVALSYSNNLCESAKRTFLERHPLAKSEVETAKLKALDTVRGHNMVYSLDQANAFIKAPRYVVLRGSKTQGAKDLDITPLAGESGGNSVRLELLPKGPGLYPTTITMVSLHDIRVYEVTFEAVKGGMSAKLDFEAPCRHQVVQEIPLNNEGDKALQIKAVISGECFVGPSQLNVDVGQTVMYPIAFRAFAQGKFSGRLELQITQTGETNTYDLSGVALAPVAEENILIECQARTRTAVTLSVPNIKASKCTYNVLTDLDVVSGPPTLDIPGSGKATYTLQVKPVKSGIQKGTVTFSLDEKNYVWYTLELHVDPPPPTDAMVVECEVRQAVQLDVPLHNPLETPVEMDVDIESKSLLGPRKIKLGPMERTVYKLFCSPLTPGPEYAKVTFRSDDLGEFWYTVDVEATPAKPEALPPLQCQLGKSSRTTMRITNPLRHDVTLAAASSSRSFVLLSDKLTLPAFGHGEAVVEYRPTSVGVWEYGKVHFEHSEAGLWEFQVSGLGEPPGLVDEVLITAEVGQSGTGMALWTNPLDKAVTVDVELEALDDEEGAVRLLLKRTLGITVLPGSTLQIPISFTPLEHAEYRAEVQVVLDPGEHDEDLLIWRYSIVAAAEAQHMGVLFDLACKAREAVETDFTVALPGLRTLDPAGEEFELSFEGLDEGLEKSLEVLKATDGITSPEEPLSFRVRFTPMVPMSKTVAAVVRRVSGSSGRWRFDVKLTVAAPDSDGKVVMEAKVGTTHIAPIWIFAPGDTPVPFEARFAPNTAAEFVLLVEDMSTELPVRPSSAAEEDLDLPDDDAPIKVGYTPVMYGAKPSGTLVVTFAGESRSIKLEGRTPQYVRPNRSRMKSTIDTGMRGGGLAPGKSSSRRAFAGGAAGAAPGKRMNYVAANARKTLGVIRRMRGDSQLQGEASFASERRGAPGPGPGPRQGGQAVRLSEHDARVSANSQHSVSERDWQENPDFGRVVSERAPPQQANPKKMSYLVPHRDASSRDHSSRPAFDLPPAASAPAPSPGQPPAGAHHVRLLPKVVAQGAGRKSVVFR
ncbi:unnamed protein product [Pedinophyceae sp. YPF-701]|nr:unnamed protein product [Pedinophyceae sp. YPF-701]